MDETKYRAFQGLTYWINYLQCFASTYKVLHWNHLIIWGFLNVTSPFGNDAFNISPIEVGVIEHVDCCFTDYVNQLEIGQIEILDKFREFQIRSHSVRIVFLGYFRTFLLFILLKNKEKNSWLERQGVLTEKIKTPQRGSLHRHKHGGNDCFCRQPINNTKRFQLGIQVRTPVE